MRRLLSLLSIIALFATSCDTTEQSPVPNAPAPVISTAESGIITVPAAGGEVKLDYQIINPTEGVELEVTASESWISDITTDDTTITFNVERNNDVQRVGILTLHYEGAEELSLAIQQNEALASGDVRLTITSERKTTFEAEGGKGEISYLLECDEEDAMPEVKSDAEWVIIDSVDDKTISYSVLQNQVEQRRTGHIKLQYAGKSAEVTIDQKAAEHIPVLTANASMIRTGESITFNVSYAGEDVTTEATIYDYYTKAAVTNPYTPTESAERVFYATYNNRTSKVLTIHVISEHMPSTPEDPAPERYDFNQRMLIVDHTGVGCGYCPDMKFMLKNLESREDYAHKFNIVYSYSFSQSEICYSSAAKTFWNYYKEVCSTSYMPLTGYPNATFNFCRDFAASPGYVASQIDEYWDANPTASVALAANIHDNKFLVNVEVKSSVAQNIHLALWVLEDDIYARQSGGYEEWMHTHHSVLRDCLTGASKSDISGIEFGYVQANSTLSKTLEFDLFKASSWDSSNFKLIAVISSPNEEFDNRYEVIDTAMCEIGGRALHDYK